MNLLATAPDWLIGILFAALAAAAIQDAVQLRISNLITVAVLALALLAIGVSGFAIGAWQNVAVFAVVLALGTLLFSRGVIGGGDAKLLAAVGFWTDFGSALLVIASIFICGGLLALAILALRIGVPDRLARRLATLRPRGGIPYGIAISAGTLVATAILRQG